GGVMLTLSGPDLAYWVNAVTFLVSASLVVRIPAGRLRSEEPITRGHWRDLLDGFELVKASRPLLTVLIAWNVVFFGQAAVNVAEVFLARDSLDAGNVGLGILVGASGLGLVVGSLGASSVLEKRGVRATYAGAIALMGFGFTSAAVSPTVWVAAVAVVVASIGNGGAIVCNALLVQRGAPDRLRGRAFTVIMSSN